MSWRARLDPTAPRAFLDNGTGIELSVEEGRDGLDATLAALTQRYGVGPAELAVDERAAFTLEGEHVIVIEAAVGGSALVCALVDGDLASVRVTGFGPVERCRPAVVELARGMSLGLGFVRRRRFRYLAPVGWSARRFGLLTELRSPDDAAIISVAPALPKQARAPLLDRLRLEQGLGELTDVDVLDRQIFRSDAGLRGPLRLEAGIIDGDRQVRGTASLADDRFLYCVRIDALTKAADPAIEAYLALLRSVEPIAEPVVARDAGLEIFAHWVS